jgi:glucokinase
MLRGFSDVAGHLGHVIVDYQGPICSCGNRGCLESIFSARAIEGAALAAIRRGCESRLHTDFSRHPEALTCLDVFAAASAGDAIAQALIQQAIAALAGAMAGMAHALDPELFLLGGQIADAGDKLFIPLRKAFFARTRRLVGRRIPVRKAALGESAGVLGAAALAWSVVDSRK